MRTPSDAEVLEWLRPFSGWDFSYLDGRCVGVRENDKPWSCDDLCIEAMCSAESVLDVDTGEDEKLSDLLQAVGCPVRLSATEGWAPNVPIARERLKPFGVEVVEADKEPLPFPDGSFDLIINRHGLFEPGDYVRLLQGGGRSSASRSGATRIVSSSRPWTPSQE